VTRHVFCQNIADDSHAHVSVCFVLQAGAYLRGLLYVVKGFSLVGRLDDCRQPQERVAFAIVEFEIVKLACN
jgi:hypothetical protein